MNNSLDPDIAAMRSADGDAARAKVLLEAPVVTLLRWRGELQALCRHDGFDAGVAYLDALAGAMRGRRHRGELAGGYTAFEALRTDLLGLLESVR